MPSVTEQSNDMDTRIEGASVGNAEKAGRKADSVQSVENEGENQDGWDEVEFITAPITNLNTSEK